MNDGSVRNALAVFVFVVVCFVAGYVGLVAFFIGGIVQVVDGIKASPTNGSDIAWGLAKVFVLAEAAAGAIVLLGAGLAYLISNEIGYRGPKLRRR